MRRPGSLALALVSSLAWAQEGGPTVQVTTDALVQQNREARGLDGTSRPNQYVGQTTCFLNGETWSAGLTLRHLNVYQAAADTTLDPAETTLHRAFIKHTSGGFSLQAGDFNAMLGRGLVLSVVQNESVLIDWTIRGLDLRYQGDRVDWHALAGTVDNGLRRASNWHQPERNDFRKWNVVGLETSLRWVGRQRIGVRAAVMEDDNGEAALGQVVNLTLGRPPRPGTNLETFTPSLGRRVTGSVNASGGSSEGTLTYEAEVAQTSYRHPAETFQLPGFDPQRGSGAYGQLVLNTHGWMVMAEGKRYRHFNNELNNAPLADRETEKGGMDNSDALRLLVQYTFMAPDLTLFASAGRHREGALYERFLQDGSHVYGGFKLQDAFGWMDAAWTWGRKTVHPLVGRYDERRSDAHLTTRFTPLWSLELNLKNRRKEAYGEWDATTQLARASWGALFVTHQYSSRVRTVENPSDWQHMTSGGVRIHLGQRSYLDLSGGRMRGGEVCAGGQCAILPAYRGWKAATHLVF